MTCEQIQDRLSPYLDGELDAASRAEVERHLAGCPECADLLACLRRAMTALAAFPEIEPSPALRRKLLDIPLRRGILGTVQEVFSRPFLRPFVAAATAFLMLFSLYMASPNKSLINKTIRRQIQVGVGQLEKLYVKAGALTDSIGEFANNVFAPAKSEASRGRSDGVDKI